MSDNRQLLELIYKNAQMGLQSLPKLIEKCDNPQLVDSLNRQMVEYNDIIMKAESFIKNDEDDKSLSGLNTFEQLRTDAMLKMNTMGNVSSGHIADMVLRGSSLGIREVSDQMRDNAGAGVETLQLAEQLRQTEQINIDEMQNFLSLT